MEYGRDIELARSFVNAHFFGHSWGWDEIELSVSDEPAAVSHAVRLPYSVTRMTDFVGRCFHGDLVLSEHEGGNAVLFRPVWIEHDEKSRFESDIYAARVDGIWVVRGDYHSEYLSQFRPSKHVPDQSEVDRLVSELVAAGDREWEARKKVWAAEEEHEAALGEEQAVAEKLYRAATGEPMQIHGEWNDRRKGSWWDDEDDEDCEDAEWVERAEEEPEPKPSDDEGIPAGDPKDLSEILAKTFGREE